MENLLLVAVALVAWVDWWIYGKKGVALLERSPMLLLWASGEALLGMLSGYVCVDAYVSHNLRRVLFVALANVVGCAGGISTSGAITWPKRKTSG